jgi:hypothetical protein
VEEGEVTCGGRQTAIGYWSDDGTIGPMRPRAIKAGDLAFTDGERFVDISGAAKTSSCAAA